MSALTSRLTRITLDPSIMSTARFWNAGRIVVVSLALFLAGSVGAETETNATSVTQDAAATSAADEEDAAGLTPEDVLRAYVQLQSLIRENQLAIEQSRLHAEESSAKAVASLSGDLKTIEQSLGGELRAVEKSLSDQRQKDTRLTMIVISVFASICFLAVALTAFFQWRSVHQFTKLAPVLSRPPGRDVLDVADASLIAAPAGNPGASLHTTLERLEKRILELEQTATPALSAGPAGAIEDGAERLATSPESNPIVLTNDSGKGVAQLLAEGQKFLEEDRPEEALERFNEALDLQPDHGEVLLKKGSALEKLRKYVEAIACYDRAIAADRTMTIAYLYKGGLFNRMERFSEAVQCYEQALQTQEKQSAA